MRFVTRTHRRNRNVLRDNNARHIVPAQTLRVPAVNLVPFGLVAEAEEDSPCRSNGDQWYMTRVLRQRRGEMNDVNDGWGRIRKV